MQYRQLLLKRILQGGINIILMDQVSEKTPVIEVISFPLTGILLGHPVNSDTIDGVDNRSSS